MGPQVTHTSGGTDAYHVAGIAFYSTGVVVGVSGADVSPLGWLMESRVVDENGPMRQGLGNEGLGNWLGWGPSFVWRHSVNTFCCMHDQRCLAMGVEAVESADLLLGDAGLSNSGKHNKLFQCSWAVWSNTL